MYKTLLFLVKQIFNWVITQLSNKLCNPFTSMCGCLDVIVRVPKVYYYVNLTYYVNINYYVNDDVNE